MIGALVCRAVVGTVAKPAGSRTPSCGEVVGHLLLITCQHTDTKCLAGTHVLKHRA